MITFKEFLAEGRTEEMNLHDAQAWMAEHAMDYLKAGKFLFRGISGRTGERTDMLFANTDEGKPRHSVGDMPNYYTLWMSNNPEWKDKPRRERSFITSTIVGDARAWGKLHLIVPANSAKISAVGANDIWNKRINTALSYADFTQQTKETLRYFYLSGKSYGELAESLKEVTYEKLKKAMEAKNVWIATAAFLKLVEEHKCADLFELWEYVFSPDKFEFSTPKDILGKGELWVDGQAVFIPLTHDLGPQTNDMIAWAEDYAPKLAELLKKAWKYDNNDAEHVDPDRVSARDTLTYQKKKNR